VVSAILNLEEERGDVQVKVVWGLVADNRGRSGLNRIERGRIRGVMQFEQNEEYEEESVRRDCS
jgi:hypothetical protein